MEQINSPLRQNLIPVWNSFRMLQGTVDPPSSKKWNSLCLVLRTAIHIYGNKYKARHKHLTANICSTSLRLPSTAFIFPSSSSSSINARQRLWQHADTLRSETKDKMSACNANCCLLNSLRRAQTKYKLRINIFIHSLAGQWKEPFRWPNKTKLVSTRENNHVTLKDVL